MNSPISLQVLSDEMKRAAIDEISALLEARWPTIWRNYAAAYQAFAEDNPKLEKQFTFPIRAGLVLAPQGKEMDVTAAVAYGVKRKHTSDGRKVQMDLPHLEPVGWAGP